MYSAGPSHDAVAYYAGIDVRRQILSSCDANGPEPPGAVFVAGLSPASEMPTWDAHAVRVPVSAIETLWEAGCDLSRSLWDRRRLIFLLDLDYQNIDEAEEPFLRPAETFFKLEPTYRAIRHVLGEHGMAVDSVATGRGYHFTGAVPWSSPVIDRLAGLVPCTPAWYASLESRLPPGVHETMPPEHARASAGLGLLIEYSAHVALSRARDNSPLPVVFNGTIVGTGTIGRECISIDFSHVGDPLDVRHFRTPFSTYQWHHWRPDIFGDRVRGHVPLLVTLPRGNLSVYDFLARGRTLEAATRLARRASQGIPDVSAGIDRLLAAYAVSPLADFHREFLAADAAGSTVPVERRLEVLPPCVAAPLERPNDLLLKPEYVQHVVRDLLARGWTPAAISALVRTKYEEDHDWGDRWTRQHAGTRAAFDVRVFAGMIATGLDSLIDFNCVSTQEKGLCPRIDCHYDLRQDRERMRDAAWT